jgi:hypothetical protein
MVVGTGQDVMVVARALQAGDLVDAQPGELYGVAEDAVALVVALVVGVEKDLFDFAEGDRDYEGLAFGAEGVWGLGLLHGVLQAEPEVVVGDSALAAV